MMQFDHGFFILGDEMAARVEKEEMDEYIPGGAFLIARKLFLSNIWGKEPMYLKTWIWIIGQARYAAGVMKGQKCYAGN